jgi:hypothetical protein
MITHQERNGLFHNLLILFRCQDRWEPELPRKMPMLHCLIQSSILKVLWKYKILELSWVIIIETFLHRNGTYKQDNAQGDFFHGLLKQSSRTKGSHLCNIYFPLVLFLACFIMYYLPRSGRGYPIWAHNDAWKNIMEQKWKDLQEELLT